MRISFLARPRLRLLLALASLAALALAGAIAVVCGLGPARAHFVEYRMEQPLDIPTAVAAAPDGTIWFTMDLAKAMGRVSNGKLERLPIANGNVEPVGLSVDRDGSAWYTDNGARGISRMTPAGAVASFALETPIVRLGRLAVAPDGAVWFAEATGYSITRLIDGQFTRHLIDSPRGEPYGVAIAPDGAVWATLKSGDQLLQITPHGDMRVFDVPRESAVPSDIAVAPDGTVWFVESRESRIGSFKDGKFQEFAVASDNPMLSGLVVTPDGAVWFGMLRTGSLGRLHEGRVETFKLPRARARPFTLAADRSANIWYADITGYVGMLTARN
jgi:virginiamycin B lyase